MNSHKTKSEYLLYIYGTSCGICQKIKLNIVEALQSCAEDEIETPFYAINIDVFGDELIELGSFSDRLVLIGLGDRPMRRNFLKRL